MKYNMHTLRAIQEMEDKARISLAPIYGCEPDEIPVDFDLLDIYQAKPESRRDILVTPSIILIFH